jgi:hypothetical protein
MLGGGSVNLRFFFEYGAKNKGTVYLHFYGSYSFTLFLLGRINPAFRNRHTFAVA